MEEKIYELQKENVFLARQLLRLSEDLQMAHERIDELEKTLKGKRMINPYMKIVTPGKRNLYGRIVLAINHKQKR